MGFTPVSIHTQFRSSFSLTMVTSRHLSTFSLQPPPSTKMPLLLWLCFAQTPMPMPTPTSTSTTCSSKLPSNQYVPSPTSSTTAVSLYRSLGCARSDTTFHVILLQARRNLITQKNENLKSADNISTHAGDGTRKVAPVKSSTWSRGSDLKFAIPIVKKVDPKMNLLEFD